MIAVVHLGDGHPGPEPALPSGGGDVNPAVVSHDHAIGLEGIDPHVVVVATGTPPLDRQSTVQGGRMAGGQEVDFVLVIGSGHHSGVIVGSLNQGVVRVHHPPGLPTVVRTPEDPLVLCRGGRSPDWSWFR